MKIALVQFRVMAFKSNKNSCWSYQSNDNDRTNQIYSSAYKDDTEMQAKNEARISIMIVPVIT